MKTPNSAHISLARASHMVKGKGKYNLTVEGGELELFSEWLLGPPQIDSTLILQMRKLRLREVFNTR